MQYNKNFQKGLDKMENKAEKARQGLEYARNILNTITVKGIDNCQRLSAVYNNIDIFLSMIANGEISLTDDSQKDTDKKSKQ